LNAGLLKASFTSLDEFNCCESPHDAEMAAVPPKGGFINVSANPDGIEVACAPQITIFGQG
jgi:hypothetical protein